MILVIRNNGAERFHDDWNIETWLSRRGHEFSVLSPIATIDELEAISPRPVRVILGPGLRPTGRLYEPLSPSLRMICRGRPVLGICVGAMQLIDLSGQPLAGREREFVPGGEMRQLTSWANERLVTMPSLFTANCANYFCLDDLPDGYQVTMIDSTTGDIMAFEHRNYPMIGWQFHPEHSKTTDGSQLLDDFLTLQV